MQCTMQQSTYAYFGFSTNCITTGILAWLLNRSVAVRAWKRALATQRRRGDANGHKASHLCAVRGGFRIWI